ncbi:uncharacterized protein BX664DRAFT_258065 [Halteromyces radiatus]|uniref:uncharacterized protein n=1 Tax=Halteromyces radiatus TaxID=101107 RepID=UPI002220D2C6|nr:uncharacterized protein BX664DRAFT_258065 [Halteromyces radiatus]KAI8097524.1 hypothetical protein BX664DRAFT_258065 [Halteromyces radiatus]
MPPKKQQKDDTATLSKAEEEEMSSALIAKLLAQDAMHDGGSDYYAEYSNDSRHYDRYRGSSHDLDDSYEEDDSDDYAPKRYGKSKKTKAKKAEPQQRGRKRKNAAIDNDNASNVPSDIKAATPNVDGSQPSEVNDAPKLSRHMGTRDPHSIRSHAQKHFIKLYRDNLPLPDKVKESGEGFTLSGKPLDPDSAAAKPYLNRMAMGTKSTPTDVAPKRTEPIVTEPIADEPMQKSTKSKSRSNSPSPDTIYEDNGRTNYASSRLRRPRSRNSINYNQLGKDDDPLTMVKCEPFIGKPGSNIQGSQPFEMSVHSNVLLTMDFHAHLMTTEIIGFLAGEWDKTTRRILVKEAYPCRSLNTGQNDVNVEMDPTSALETRQLIEDKNMTVVGWYHSHPTFIPDPSLVDIENQCNYQRLCRDELLEPFVGAIVGPYDPRLPASASVINWFHVGSDWNAQRVPKRLVYDLLEDQELSVDEEKRLLQLPIEYKSSPEKVIFGEYWRQDIHETKLEKLIKSLGTRMPWIQQKVRQLQQQQQQQEDVMAKLSSTVDDIKMVDDQNENEINNEDVTMEGQEQIVKNNNNLDGNGTIDTFLQKIQMILKDW